LPENQAVTKIRSPKPASVGSTEASVIPTAHVGVVRPTRAGTTRAQAGCSGLRRAQRMAGRAGQSGIDPCSSALANSILGRPPPPRPGSENSKGSGDPEPEQQPG